MLQSIRERAQGWVAWAIVIFISIPFALWGIQSYLGGGEETVVASVNDREITEREFNNNYQRFRSNLARQLGGSFNPALFNEAQMREDLLERMVRNELVLQTAESMGIGVSDAHVRSMIASIPEFQSGGRFDKAVYENYVRQQGQSTAQFEQQIREAIVSEQFSRAVSQSELITDKDMEIVSRLRDQRRELSYVRLAADNFVKPDGVGEADIQAHYDANQAEFMAPEQVKLDYLELSVSSLADSIEVSEENLQAYFQSHRGDYVTLERRQASHILIVPEGDGEEAEAAAKELATSVYERLQGGGNFAEVAKNESDDPGSAQQGGDLGFVEEGMMDEVFETALFKLEKDEISAPVRSSFGFHIIKLTGIEAGSEKGLDEVRDEVGPAYRRQEAERQFYEIAERLADLAYEHPDSLEPAADTLGLKVSSSDWLSSTATDIPGGAKAMAAAFSQDVLVSGNNSEMVEVGAEHVVVVRVREHKEAAAKPFEEVKEEIASRLQKQQGSELAREMGESMLKRARSGEALDQVAGEIAQTVEHPGVVGRDDPKLDPAISQALFSMPKPAEGEIQFGHAESKGDFVIIALKKVENGSLEGKEEVALENTRRSLERSRGRVAFQHLVQHLRDNADVTITQ